MQPIVCQLQCKPYIILRSEKKLWPIAKVCHPMYMSYRKMNAMCSRIVCVIQKNECHVFQNTPRAKAAAGIKLVNGKPRALPKQKQNSKPVQEVRSAVRRSPRGRNISSPYLTPQAGTPKGVKKRRVRCQCVWLFIKRNHNHVKCSYIDQESLYLDKHHW